MKPASAAASGSREARLCRASQQRRAGELGRLAPCAIRAITASPSPGGCPGSGSLRSSDTVARSSRSSLAQVRTGLEMRLDAGALFGDQIPFQVLAQAGAKSPSASRLDSFGFLGHERSQSLAQARCARGGCAT